jgi:L-alanine-DL-glutamate epimerase-like enolase superfamily enzyme
MTPNSSTVSNTTNGPAAGATISGFRTRVFVRKSERPQWNPRTRWSEKRVILVELTLEDGTRGVGEAYCDGGAAESVIAIIERDLAPRLVGQSPLLTRRLWQEMVETTIVSCKGGAAYAAISALDTALWDLAGKVLNQPVYRLLGGTRDKVPVYASGGLYGEGKSLEDLAAEMAGYVEQGFPAVKMKIGGVSLPKDIDRVRAVREAIGPDVSLMVDALYAYSAEQALQMARRLEPFDVRFLEAPVHPGNLEGLKEVCSRSAVPVAGNEFAYGVDAFRELILAGVHVIHADVILCGGISAAMRVADLADAFHRPISFHAASSLVCLTANAHVAAAASNAESVEYHMIHKILFDKAASLPFELVDGHLQLGNKAGLGLDLNLED